MKLLINDHLRARRALYGLLAQLYLRPPDAALLERLRDLPGFAEHVPADVADLEALQVEYEFIFGRNVYPYESLYVDRELMLNTAAAERAARLYEECGYADGVREAGAPDHLGLELALMAHLLSIEIAARAEDAPEMLAWVHAQQRACLHDHLAQWAPICLRAVERVATHPLYQASARITCELVLGDIAAAVGPEPRMIRLEPAAEQPDEGEERGINRVVRQLITPDAVGVFLSRGDLSAIGRKLGLPTPIGERFLMLRGLFESAGQFELVAALLDALGDFFATEMQQIDALASSYPAWSGGANRWRERLLQGRALLDELRAQTNLHEESSSADDADSTEFPRPTSTLGPK
jgi:TorA maturation chaperone TorD